MRDRILGGGFDRSVYENAELRQFRIKASVSLGLMICPS